MYLLPIYSISAHFCPPLLEPDTVTPHHLSLCHWLQPCDCTSGHKLLLVRARGGRALCTWANHVRGSSQHRRLLLPAAVSALCVLRLG